jgi:hypothetical protein
MFRNIVYPSKYFDFMMLHRGATTPKRLRSRNSTRRQIGIFRMQQPGQVRPLAIMHCLPRIEFSCISRTHHGCKTLQADQIEASLALASRKPQTPQGSHTFSLQVKDGHRRSDSVNTDDQSFSMVAQPRSESSLRRSWLVSLPASVAFHASSDATTLAAASLLPIFCEHPLLRMQKSTLIAARNEPM